MILCFSLRARLRAGKQCPVQPEPSCTWGPALYNQDDLVALREKEGVNDLVPGLTGWAQVNGRDDLPIAEKVKIEAEYLGRRSFVFDLLILFLTLKNVVTKKGVSH